MGPIRENPQKYMGEMVITPDGDLAQIVWWNLECGCNVMLVGLKYLTSRFISGNWFRKSIIHDEEIDSLILCKNLK